jgi:hypothetical protein
MSKRFLGENASYKFRRRSIARLSLAQTPEFVHHGAHATHETTVEQKTFIHPISDSIVRAQRARRLLRAGEIFHNSLYLRLTRARLNALGSLLLGLGICR